jgi:flagellar biosynthesis/type III secretory pathway protein FliH
MLPQEIQKQIESEAQQSVLKLKEGNDYQAGYSRGCEDGYEKGATVWAEKALEREKVLVEALFWIDAYTQDELIKQYIEVKLASYRGEKEVGNG